MSAGRGTRSPSGLCEEGTGSRGRRQRSDETHENLRRPVQHQPAFLGRRDRLPVLRCVSGFIPFIATSVAVPMGWDGMAWVYLACGTLGLIGTVLIRETWGAKQHVDVDALIKIS